MRKFWVPWQDRKWRFAGFGIALLFPVCASSQSPEFPTTSENSLVLRQKLDNQLEQVRSYEELMEVTKIVAEQFEYLQHGTKIESVRPPRLEEVTPFLAQDEWCKANEGWPSCNSELVP